MEEHMKHVRHSLIKKDIMEEHKKPARHSRRFDKQSWIYLAISTNKSIVRELCYDMRFFSICSAQISTHINAYIYICIHIYVYIQYTHIYIYIYIHTNINVYINFHNSKFLRNRFKISAYTISSIYVYMNIYILFM